MKKFVLLAAVLFASVTFTYAQIQFTSIDYPGGFGTRTRGINNHGQIVGSYDTEDGNRHALLIQKGKFIPLAPETILGTDYSEAFKINDRGDVVGWDCDDVTCHAFLLSKKGVLTLLDFPGATLSYGFDINESGTVAGVWDLYDSQGNFPLRGRFPLEGRQLYRSDLSRCSRYGRHSDQCSRRFCGGMGPRSAGLHYPWICLLEGRVHQLRCTFPGRDSYATGGYQCPWRHCWAGVHRLRDRKRAWARFSESRSRLHPNRLCGCGSDRGMGH